jgi:uncharacterized membrane protein
MANASRLDHVNTTVLDAGMTAPTYFERLLGLLATAMLLTVCVALWRGQADWGRIAPLIWVHLSTVMIALALTPVLLWSRRGDTWHRRLGWTWAIAMFATALVTFGLRLSNHGHFSFIHILSVTVIVAVPVAVLAARRHDVARHRRGMRALIIGALLTAGFFTFPFGRLLGRWLLG